MLDGGNCWQIWQTTIFYSDLPIFTLQIYDVHYAKSK